VLAVVQDDEGRMVGLPGPGGHFQRCGHRHPDVDTATMCPWMPVEPWPQQFACIVRQVRTPDGREPWRQGVMW
jgi:hypothetical protein